MWVLTHFLKVFTFSPFTQRSLNGTRQTLPIVQQWAIFENRCAKFVGFLPIKHGSKKLPISGKCEYLQTEICYRQTKKQVVNYEGFPTSWRNLVNFGPQVAEIFFWDLTNCHGHYECVHAEVTEGQWTKLCHMFRSEPDLKMHVQNLFVVGCLWRANVHGDWGEISRGFCSSWPRQVPLSLSSWRGVCSMLVRIVVLFRWLFTYSWGTQVKLQEDASQDAVF